MSIDGHDTADIAPFNRDQAAFLRTMGHELRSPLNSILATAEMMTNGMYGALPSQQEKAAQRILRNSHNLLNLINSAMTYIRVQANTTGLISAPVSPVEMLKAQIAGSQERATAKGLALDLDVQPGTVEEIQGDPDQIALVVNELLNNAISFTASGRVQLKVGNAGADHWVLTVADTGSGIEPADLAFVFVPFWRSREAKLSVPGGNGLGLATVREMVSLMRGRIDVQSERGKGTTVTMTLPNLMPATP